MLLLSYIAVLPLSSWLRSIVFSFFEITDLLAWAVVKDWTVVEGGMRGFNTPGKTPIAEGSNTPRKRRRMQSDSPTPMPTSSTKPMESDAMESDGNVFDVISLHIFGLTVDQI
jgi:hypothetical protein